MIALSQHCDTNMTDIHALWLTGASSQIGVAILLQLQEAGVPLTAVTYESPAPVAYDGFMHKQMDLRDEGAFPEEAECSSLIHTAPIWLLPAHIPHLARAGLKRLVAFSSTSLFGKESSADSHEQAVVRHLQDAEAAIHALCAQHSIQWTILRPTLVYGMGMDRSITLIRTFVQRYGFFPILPPALGLRQPVHAVDLADAALHCLNAHVTYNKAYNLSGGETLAYRAMVERIFAALDKPPRILATRHLPRLLRGYARLTGSALNAQMAYRMNEDLVFDHAEANEDFGYQPRSFLAGGKADLFMPS